MGRKEDRGRKGLIHEEATGLIQVRVGGGLDQEDSNGVVRNG